METCKHLPDLVLHLDEGVDDVHKLLKIIKPQWQEDQIQIKALSGGCACYMYRCSVDSQSNDSVTVRATRLLEGYADSNLERKVLKVMSANGCFSPLLAMFKNGYCYQYVQGEQLCHREMKRVDIGEDVLRTVARQMATIHTARIPDVDYSKTNFFEFFHDMLSSCDELFEGCPNKNVFIKEWELVTEAATAVKSPMVVIHGDPHVNNIIWNKDKQSITFVDWELCRVAPRAEDIAYFLYSIDYFTLLYQIPPTKPKDFERQFCKDYVKRCVELNKNSKSSDSATKMLDQVLLELSYFRLVVHFQWLIYMVKFAKILDEEFAAGKEKAYDFIINRYLTAKKEILGIGCFGKSANNQINQDETLN